MGSGKRRWKIPFCNSPSATKKQPPTEFTCPLSGSLMADPVIVSSGQTFERNCVQACKCLGLSPILSDGSTPDFSAVIPNLALKSTILNWCNSSLVDHPKPIDNDTAENVIRALMASKKQQFQETKNKTQGAEEDDNNGANLTAAQAELNRRPSHFSSSSEESVAAATSGSSTPLPLTTRPSCCSCSSSSEIDVLNPSSVEEDDVVAMLKSSQVFEQEEAVKSLRKITRTREDTRAQLCTPRILSALRSLITSRYATLQVNVVAALVNLSLENQNKVKMLRSGIVPPLIDVLKGGFPEAQDHAAGALFSLALDDQNKTAIGVLGALPPLLHALRSDSQLTRHDSALALYHLSRVQSNRAKLVKLGSVNMLLGMVRSGHMTGRVLLVLCNLAACVEGRAAMLDCGAVECFIGMLGRHEWSSESTRESCVAALYGLSLGGLRFKGLAKEAGAEEVLRKVEEGGSQRARTKARLILEMMMKGRDEEEVDWEELLYSGEFKKRLWQWDSGGFWQSHERFGEGDLEIYPDWSRTPMAIPHFNIPKPRHVEKGAVELDVAAAYHFSPAYGDDGFNSNLQAKGKKLRLFNLAWILAQMIETVEPNMRKGLKCSSLPSLEWVGGIKKIKMRTKGKVEDENMQLVATKSSIDFFLRSFHFMGSSDSHTESMRHNVIHAHFHFFQNLNAEDTHQLAYDNYNHKTK
ncbi:hypothetical protein U1Q18_038423 [Sarracenia purpurea var. burkii]